MDNIIPASRRLLGAALRRHRERAGASLSDVAQLLDRDASKISRIETGKRGIRARELLELLDEYGVPDGEQEVLLALARRPGDRGWWEEFSAFLPGAYRDYLVMESVATETWTYQAQVVPPLLQTREYARAVATASPDIPQDWEEQMVQAALTRQRVTLTERGALVNAVVSEAVLRQEVGGSAVMRAQLSRLASLAEGADPHVTVRLLPFSAGATAALAASSPTLLRFSQAPDIGLVQLPGLAGGVCFEDPATVKAYRGALAQFVAIALSPGESARGIRARIRQ